MANVFDFLDYRAYLRAAFDELKTGKPHFSHRSLMQKLSLRAPGHILFIMQGKRRLTEEIALRLAAYFKMNKREESYLLALVRYTNAKTPAEKQYAFEEMVSMRNWASVKIAPASYRFYEKWYYSVIRAALDVEPFSGDYARLAASLCPPITAAEAKKAVELLLELGIITKDEQGFMHPAESSITPGDTWQSATIHNLHRQFINLARESLDRTDKEERDISTMTVTVSEESFELIRKKMRDLRAQIRAMACAEQAPDRVLQVNFQLFPLLRKQGRS